MAYHSIFGVFNIGGIGGGYDKSGEPRLELEEDLVSQNGGSKAFIGLESPSSRKSMGYMGSYYRV